MVSTTLLPFIFPPKVFSFLLPFSSSASYTRLILVLKNIHCAIIFTYILATTTNGADTVTDITNSTPPSILTMTAATDTVTGGTNSTESSIPTSIAVGVSVGLIVVLISIVVVAIACITFFRKKLRKKEE